MNKSHLKLTKARITNRLHFTKRRQKLLKLIKNVGEWNIDKTLMAKEFNVSRVSIYKDLKALKKELKRPDINSVNTQLTYALIKAINECMKILDNKNTTHSNKLNAARTVGYLSEKFAKHMEDFFDKEKAADRQEIEQNIIVKWEEPEP